MTLRIVAVHSGPQIEIWLAVHADGQIVLHLENDGPALLRRGAQARGRAIEDMEEIKQLARRYDRPRLMQEVDAAFRALAPR